MTILVETPVSRDMQAPVAQELLRYDSIFAEQAGFIEQPGSSAAWARLQMMGGEFCGNATMALAAFLVWQRKDPEGAVLRVPLEVSGSDGIIECGITVKSGCFLGTVNMPVPEKIERCKYPVNGGTREFPTVFLPGITHILVPLKDAGDDPRAFAGEMLDRWEPLLEAGAYGVILLDESARRFEPLVRVKSSGSTVWERGCGTGTAAIGAFLSDRDRKGVKVDLAQPGGIITADVSYAGGQITGVRISGSVRIVGRGTAYI